MNSLPTVADIFPLCPPRLALPPPTCGRPIMLSQIPWPLERSRRWIHYTPLLNVNNRSLTSTSEPAARWCMRICCSTSPRLAFLEFILALLPLQICGTHSYLQGQRGARGQVSGQSARKGIRGERRGSFDFDPDVFWFILDHLGLKTCSLEEPR